MKICYSHKEAILEVLSSPEEEGITVPLGIHVGSPESMPGCSLFISIATFCYHGEKEGWELCFTQ